MKKPISFPNAVLKNFMLSDLKAAAYNPREISDKSYSGLKYSLEEFGDLSGITFNIKTGNLVTGHQRVKALKEKYGDIKIESDRIRTPDGNEFKIRVVSWPLKKEKAANIAANHEGLQGDFTPDLHLILDEIKNDSPDLFSSLLFDEIKLPVDYNLEQDEKMNLVPKPGKKAFSRKGDVFLFDRRHKIYCQDSTIGENINFLFDGKKTVACITDPPYSVDYENQRRKKNSPTRAERGDAYKDPPAEVVLNFIDHIPGDLLIMSYPINKHFHLLAERTKDWDLLYDCVWVKHHFAFIMSRKYQPRHEPILIFRKRKHGKTIFNVPNNQSTVFEFDKPARNPEHPTIKPVELYILLIKYQSNLSDIIYDPFLGSGTTLIAAEIVDRICYGLESEPVYIDLIIRRYNNLFPDKKIECLSRRDFPFQKIFKYKS